MKKVFLIIIAVLMAFSLCACVGEKEPTAVEKARAEAEAARDALESISGAVDELEDQLESVKSLLGY